MTRNAKQTRNLWTLLGATGGLSALIVVVVVIPRWSKHTGQAEDRSPEIIELSESWTPPLEVDVKSESKREIIPSHRELTPVEVIDNPDCRMRIGSGSASGLAVVVVPSENGAEFSVLDETGALYTGTMPFVPNHYKLGKRSDGSVVAGFGDLRLNSHVFREEDSPEPLRIYLGDQILYEHNKIWEFGIADDGTSYWVIEPLDGRNSRLVIRNLDEGTESHHDLGDKFAPDGYYVPFGASYTENNDELHLWPSDIDYPERGEGVHYFFPTKSGNKERRIRIRETGPFDKTILVSSREGFFFSTRDGDVPTYEVSKRRFDWTTGEVVTVWTREGPSGVATSDMQPTRDGAWLLFETYPAPLHVRARPIRDNDWTLYVLDASTGEEAFVFPKVDKKAQLMRLANVLAHGATEEDMGSFGQAFIADGQLVIRRRFQTDGQPDHSRGAYDVFNMNTIEPYGQPDFRVPANRWSGNPCASESFPGRLRAREDGRLAYAVAQ